jgi:hypothetical protein
VFDILGWLPDFCRATQTIVDDGCAPSCNLAQKLSIEKTITKTLLTRYLSAIISCVVVIVFNDGDVMLYLCDYNDDV